MCEELGVRAVTAEHWARGGEGAVELAEAVRDALESGGDGELLYGDAMGLAEKIRTVATTLYGAADIALGEEAARQLGEFEALGFGHLPVCIAKTPYSFSSDPDAKGAPTGHVLPVREARLAAGAGFVVAVCGDVMMMPGLPRDLAATRIGLDETGSIMGLG